MPNSFTLEDLRDDLDKEFAPLKITVGGEEFVLQNLLRVGEKSRKAVRDALKDIEDVDPDEAKEKSLEDVDRMVGTLELILRTVTAKGKGDKLVAAIDGDVMLAMKVVELWSEATQPGEAQNSPA